MYSDLDKAWKRHALIVVGVTIVLIVGLAWLRRLAGHPDVGDIGAYTRQKCQTHMLILGEMLSRYATSHGGQYPDHLEDLFSDGYLPEMGLSPPEYFVCPGGNETPVPARSRAEWSANLSSGSHLSYIYVGAGMNNKAPENTILLFEPLSHHKQGINILLLNGNVEYVSGRVAEQILRAAPKPTGTSSR